MSKIYYYTMTSDSGFAPNCSNGVCTLACCKPAIRNRAEVGDYVMGIAGAKMTGIENRIIFIMKVENQYTFDEYHRNLDSKTGKKIIDDTSSRIDNIYYIDEISNEIRQIDNPLYHKGQDFLEHDTKVDSVLLSRDFYYWGRNALEIPRTLDINGTGIRNYKNSLSDDEIVNLINYIKSVTKPGQRIYGEPYSIEGCGSCFRKKKTTIDLNNKSVLITGSPGFIGANLVLRLLKEMHGGRVVSLDNMNDYYDPSLKEYRLSLIEKSASASEVEHIFVKGSIADKNLVDSLFEKYHFDVVVNLAAQAGVRYSIDHPDVYIQSNLIGFYNILEACRHSYDYSDDDYKGVQHLVYASSSSVYGGNKKVPFSTDDKVDNPVSLYAATKKSNELLAHSYSKLYNIPSTGLRFFTVYGPCGRPDMFYFSATNKLAAGKTIQIFNYGNCKRDFTYVDDIVEGVYRVMQGAPEKSVGDDGLPIPPYAVYNIGGGQPENLLDYIRTLQEELVRAGVLPKDYDFEGHRELVGMQPGDVPVTYADSVALERDYGFTPKIGIREGLRKFAEWYKNYYMN